METVSYQTKQDKLIAEIERRGLKLERYPASVRVTGNGLDIRATRLDFINFDDLKPVLDWRANRP